MLHPVLQLDELALQPKQLGEIPLARQLVGGQHVAGAIHVTVFDLELQLFVIAVDQVVGDALHQLLRIELGVVEHGMSSRTQKRICHSEPIA
ncbi:hypothetical protein D3C71_1546670 [compost metagenome]